MRALRRLIVKLRYESQRSRAMRYLLYLIVMLAVLWAGDRYFYKGRYFNDLWFGLNQEALNIQFEIRRLTRL